MKTCPSCKLENEQDARRCQCGWWFAPEQAVKQEAPRAHPHPPRATPAVKAELDPAPPKRGTMVFAFFASMAIAPVTLFPAGMAMGAGAPPALGVIIGVVSWLGGACLVSAIIAGRHWAMPRSLLRGFGIYLGGQTALAALGAGLVMLIVLLAGFVFKNASCPHVYASDGTTYRLDADPLSGAFQRGAAREDLVRLDHAREVKGRYALSIRDELPEKDTIEQAVLVIVDHDATADVLPTQEGKILGVTRTAPPLEARDGSGADRRADLLAEGDGAFVAADGRDTASMTLTFAAPEQASAYALALRAHNTPFAEEALVRYLATMGPGLGKLMNLAEQDSSYAFRERIHDEIRKLGLPLYLDVDTGEGFRQLAELQPVGPAVQRTQAVAIPAVTGKVVRLRLRWTSRFWAIDEARLGAAVEITPTATLRAVAEPVTLTQGQSIALDLEAPGTPPKGAKRTVLLQVRGYYEMDYGDGWWINPGAIVAHDSGLDSLPAFARRLARLNPDLVKRGVR